MKILLILALTIYTANGFSFSNIFSQNEEISSLAASCVGVPDGTRLPDESNCQKFTLCDGGMGLTLSCRTSDPHFNRCTSSCVNDPSVCQLKDCPGDSTTTPPTTTPPTTTPPTTTPPTTTPPTTTPPTTTPPTTTPPTTTPPTTTPPTTTPPTTTPPTTTTRFIPPTVPIGCNPACKVEDMPDETVDPLCTCPERWGCKDQKCVCDEKIKCPMGKTACEGTIASGGCGCPEACDCTGDAGEEICTCKKDVVCTADCPEVCGCTRNCDCNAATNLCTCINDGRQCPFDAAYCMLRCGCNTNCDKISFTPLAVCLEPCRCQDAYLCPFDKSECVTKCGCEKRCVITGNLARCDPDILCTSTAHDFFRNFWHQG